jgi:hypothetical protein
MNTNGQGLWQRSIRSLLLSGVLLGAIGCTTGSDSSLLAATESEQPLTAEQHLVVASSFNREARSQVEAAEHYQGLADSMNTATDPKGFRRAAFVTAAQEHRRKAADLEQQYAFHQHQAQALTNQAARH